MDNSYCEFFSNKSHCCLTIQQYKDELSKVTDLRTYCEKALRNLRKYIEHTHKEYHQDEVMIPYIIHNPDVPMPDKIWVDMDLTAPFNPALIETVEQRKRLRYNFFKARNAVNSFLYWMMFLSDRIWILIRDQEKSNINCDNEADNIKILRSKMFNN